MELLPSRGQRLVLPPPCLIEVVLETQSQSLEMLKFGHDSTSVEHR